jgi:hypothetical protein
MHVATDGTDFYGVVSHSSSAYPKVYKFSHTDGSTLWSATPLGSGTLSTNFHSEIMYVTGSKQLIVACKSAGAAYTVFILDTADGTTLRTLSTPPFDDTGAGHDMDDAGVAHA